MTAEQITTILSNLITGSGVVFFLWMWIRGLKAQIGTLNETIEVQKKTLEAMEKRVSETEKIGDIYKRLTEELPGEIDKYRNLITKLKDDQISELEKANQHKDERLKKTVEIEIDKLELQQQALEDIPRLREELIEIVSALQQRLSVVNLLALTTPLTPHLAYMTSSTRATFASPFLHSLAQPSIEDDLRMGNPFENGDEDDDDETVESPSGQGEKSVR